MKVLVIGGGGREHAICWAVARSGRVSDIVCVPGNAGIAAIAHTEPGNVEDVPAMIARAERVQPDLTIVGPEAPLVLGLADELRSRGYRVVGHSSAAARLEGSKIFAKEFMARHDIPTARFVACDTPDAARAAIRDAGFGLPVVIKADGLAAGKGVRIAQSVNEADEAIQAFMVDRELGAAGERVLIEEAMSGREASLLYFTDGARLAPMPAAQDYKRIGDGDQGPNTGGMGTFSVDGLVDAELARRVLDSVAVPTLVGMRAEGCPLSGILYVGLMLTADGPRVLEYNMRFGDPETQSVLKRLDSDVVELFSGIADGSLADVEPVWSSDAAMCLVLASQGYPGAYAKGKPITGIGDAEAIEGVTVFHAGTARDADGTTVTAGGRVLGVTARAATLEKARASAYEAARRIHFDGMTFRTDIGAEAGGK